MTMTKVSNLMTMMTNVNYDDNDDKSVNSDDNDDKSVKSDDNADEYQL